MNLWDAGTGCGRRYMEGQEGREEKDKLMNTYGDSIERCVEKKEDQEKEIDEGIEEQE